MFGFGPLSHVFRNPLQLPASAVELVPGLFPLLVIHVGGLLTHVPVYAVQNGNDDLQIAAHVYRLRFRCTSYALCLQEQRWFGQNPLAHLGRAVAPSRV